MNNPGESALQLVQSISSVLIGKENQIKQVVVALLARGHILIEDIPGVGKTLLALATAPSMGVRFKRIQFTSDTLPSDVLGVNVYNPRNSEFEFKEGPIFTEVLLADEINRTSPRPNPHCLRPWLKDRFLSMGALTLSLSPFWCWQP